MTLFEFEICKYLDIPAIPKKAWDGKKSFKDGVAIVTLKSGQQAYVAVTFDCETDNKPRVKKVFTLEQFNDISDIYVVPSYMDSDIEAMDLDEESKEKAQFLVEEATDIVEETPEEEATNEYFFDNIHNDEEAKAFIKAYNKKMKNKARVPKSHDGLIMRLSVIHAEMEKK